MDNPLVTTLTVTLVGMAVVFAAMGLLLGSMALLTRLSPETPTTSSRNGNHVEAPGDLPRRQALHRAAAVAVALARARQVRELEEPDIKAPLTPWGEYHHQRQLRPFSRGRIA
jgi:Na+-transporting methylmalonyl-CoA/oxaloacetate decarboxylase gamma subunit